MIGNYLVHSLSHDPSPFREAGTKEAAVPSIGQGAKGGRFLRRVDVTNWRCTRSRAIKFIVVMPDDRVVDKSLLWT